MKIASSFTLKSLLLFLVFTFGCTTITTENPSTTPSPNLPTSTATTSLLPPTETPVGGLILPIRGVYIVNFERRGWGSGYYSGEAITNFNTVDPIVGHTVGEEISIQLDLMKEMGVNTITYEMRAADPISTNNFVFPECNIGPGLGFQYPEPTETEITNFIQFLDMLESKDIKMLLRLVNTHMEEDPPINNTIWLGTILEAIKDHPALELVLFEGETHWNDSDGDGVDDACGVPAEPPLWMGPNHSGAIYVKWAIEYANSLGLPYQKLSAEAIVGDYYSMHQGPSGPAATDMHLWDSIQVLKGIFDDIGIPNDQRTYALSLHERHKCTASNHLPCTEVGRHTWAIETIEHVFDVVGRDNRARVIIPEMGFSTWQETPDPDWNTETALMSLVWIMQNYGVEGGSFYSWVGSRSWEDFDPDFFAQPILRRGKEFTYNPVQEVLEALYTFGETENLDLSPDDTPPTFTSAVTTPTILKNGDSLEIIANLDETHLFVTVDLSPLDSGKTDLIVLIDRGDGIYTRSVTISPWNVAENGIKNLEVNAMDFWGNKTSITINLELKNPTRVTTEYLNDSFDGTDLNTEKWQMDVTGGGTVAQDDKLIVNTSVSSTYSHARIQSTRTITGDFDIQVNFQIDEGWSYPANDHLDGANFGVIIDGQSYLITRLRRSNGDDVMMVWSSTDSLFGEAPINSLTGKLRILRVGDTLILLYDIGQGWVELASTLVPPNSARVQMGNGSINAGYAFTSYFDDFHVNSGSIID